MKRNRIILLLVLLGAGTGLSSLGQQAVTVLEIEPGVSMLGAGGAGISVVNGAETLYYNAAGLAELPGISFSSFYASYLGVANYSAFSLTLRNWGLGALLFNSGGIQGYDDTGNPTETLAYKNSAILFGVGLRPNDLPFLPTMGFDFSLGARIKYLSVAIAEETGSGFAFDLAFRTEFPGMQLGPLRLSDLAVGVSAVNLFGAVAYDTQNENFSMDIKIGGSARFAEVVLAALDLHLSGATHVGVVYSPVPTLNLRLGMISRDGLSLTAGVGVNVEGFLIDYAFVSDNLGGTHRVSLTLDFSSLDIRALSNLFRRILP